MIQLLLVDLFSFFVSFNERNIKNKILENIESTVKWRRRFESEMNLPKSGVSYTFIW